MVYTGFHADHNRMGYVAVFTLIILITFTSVCFADASVSGAPSLSVNSSQLGDVTIYVNNNNASNFCLINNLPVSMSSSTVYGYILDNNGNPAYTVYFYTFSTDYVYRVYGSTQPNQTFTINSFNESESTIDIKKFSSSYNQLFLFGFIGILGMLSIMIFFRRS